VERTIAFSIKPGGFGIGGGGPKCLDGSREDRGVIGLGFTDKETRLVVVRGFVGAAVVRRGSNGWSTASSLGKGVDSAVLVLKDTETWGSIDGTMLAELRLPPRSI